MSLFLLMLAALVCGGIALLIARLRKRTINYTAGLRLSVVALTPPIILGGLVALAGHSPPLILSTLLALTYLYIAVGAARKVNAKDLFLDDEPIGH